MNVENKTFFSTTELAKMALDNLPHNANNIRIRAEKENWQSRPRSGRGGGVEYAFSSLPLAVQAEIKARNYKALLPVQHNEQRLEKLSDRDTKDFDRKQRAVADARLLLVCLVEKYAIELGSKTKAVQFVSDLSRTACLPIVNQVDYNVVCKQAVAQKSQKMGVGVRVLHQWCNDAQRCDSAEQRLQLLAPQKHGVKQVDVSQIAWLPDFLAVYRNTKGLKVTEAYRIFAPNYTAKTGKTAPSISTVHYALDKLPDYIREAGRLTGAKMRALRTYVKRDWSVLRVNDVWVGDGHSLKMKVKHPEHGRPFTPEVTFIMDTASRYVVGWSLSYSESQIAVADALRHAVSRFGVPAIYYSDNGGGQSNLTFDADITGILPRLGIHHETGIPGNPQGRGIIERLMQTLAKPIAQFFETYYGSSADPETTRKTLRAVESLAKAEAEGKDLTPLQVQAKGKLPSWTALLEVIEQAVHWYNHEHVHREIQTTPALMRQGLLAKMDAEDIVMLTDVEMRDLFRPAFVRVVERGWLTLFHNHYWHQALEPLHGDKVLVCVDQHDASQVIVRDLKDQFICEAKLDGNKCDAFPMSLVEKKRAERVKGMLKRADEKRLRAEAELRPAIEQQLDDYLLTSTVDIAPTVQREYALFECEIEPNKAVNE